MCDGVDDLCVWRTSSCFLQFSLHAAVRRVWSYNETRPDQLKVSDTEASSEINLPVECQICEKVVSPADVSKPETLFCCVPPLMLLVSLWIDLFRFCQRSLHVTSWRLRIMTSIFFKVTQTDYLLVADVFNSSNWSEHTFEGSNPTASTEN